MNVYVDSSVVLRIVLGEPGALASWRRIQRAISSHLVRLECLRTIDRARVRLALADGEVAEEGFEQAGHGLFDLVDKFVDNGVKLDLDAFVLGFVGDAAVDAGMEAKDDGVGSGGEGDIGLGDGSDSAVDDLEGDLLGIDLLEGFDDGFDRTLRIGLDDDLEGLGTARF